MTRAAAEIAEHYEKVRDGDLFGFKAEVLIPYLPFDLARPYLKPEATADDWTPEPLDEDAVMDEVSDYMTFAWGKVADHRGISAERSVEKMLAWLFVLGRDDITAEVATTEYAQYGAPQLAVICRALHLPIPEDEAVRRMIDGQPCEPGCVDGCGS